MEGGSRETPEGSRRFMSPRAMQMNVHELKSHVADNADICQDAEFVLTQSFNFDSVPPSSWAESQTINLC